MKTDAVWNPVLQVEQICTEPENMEKQPETKDIF